MGAFVKMPRVKEHPRRGFQSRIGIHKPCLHTRDRDINISHDTSIASYNYPIRTHSTRVETSSVERLSTENSREVPMGAEQQLEANPELPDPNSSDPCPLCGSPYTMVTIVGPDEAVVSPCGCRLPP